MKLESYTSGNGDSRTRSVPDTARRAAAAKSAASLRAQAAAKKAQANALKSQATAIGTATATLSQKIASTNAAIRALGDKVKAADLKAKAKMANIKNGIQKYNQNMKKLSSSFNTNFSLTAGKTSAINKTGTKNLGRINPGIASVAGSMGMAIGVGRASFTFMSPSKSAYLPSKKINSNVGKSNNSLSKSGVLDAAYLAAKALTSKESGMIRKAVDTAATLFRHISTGAKIVTKGDKFIIKGTTVIAEQANRLPVFKDIKGTVYNKNGPAFLEATGGISMMGSGDFNIFSGASWGEAASLFKGNLPAAFKKAFVTMPNPEEIPNPTKSQIISSSIGGFVTNTYGFSKDKGVFGNAGTALSYLGIALDVGGRVVENHKNGATAAKQTGDVVAYTVKGLGKMAAGAVGAKIGGAIGTAIPIPIVGTLVGAAAGFAIGWVAGNLYEKLVDGVKIGDKTIVEHGSAFVEGIANGVGTAVTSVAKGVTNVASSIGDAVGNFFSGAGKSKAFA